MCKQYIINVAVKIVANRANTRAIHTIYIKVQMCVYIVYSSINFNCIADRVIMTYWVFLFSVHKTGYAITVLVKRFPVEKRQNQTSSV